MPAYAAPARYGEVPPDRVRPEESACERVVRRIAGGHGRRPGAIVVPVSVHLEVKNAKGRFVGANSPANIAVVSGDEADFRILVSNLSLYEVENVVVEFSYTPAPRGPALEGIGSVRGANYSESEKTFILDRVSADDIAAVSFTVFFLDDLTEETAKGSVTLKDFSVASETLLPQRTPETPFERRNLTGTVERFGIGSVDHACFRGDAVAPSLSRNALPPALTPIPRNISLRVEKTANVTEVSAGSQIIYTVSVTNTGEEALREITLDDRFSSSHLRVLEGGGGDILAAGIQWHRGALATGDRWIVRYRAEVLPGVPQGEQIETTATVTGEQLRDTPTTLRAASASVFIIARLPATGANLSLLYTVLQIALGVVIAIALVRIALAVALRKFE